MGIGAAAMLIPAIHASALDLDRVAQPFFYGAILFGVLTLLLALVTQNHKIRNQPRSQLVTLLAAFTVLPLMLAIPMREATAGLSLFDAYFEMVSSMTTTGATIFDSPDVVPDPVHLWRALVGWLGGFLMLLSAVAILAPLNLGGFEVLRPTMPRGQMAHTVQRAAATDRLARYCVQLLPLYGTATALLWLFLLFTGVDAFRAICIAMSTLSTSGILPDAEFRDTNTGYLGEGVVLVFLLFAVSRQSVSGDTNREGLRRFLEDREFRLAFIAVATLTLAVLLGRFIRAVEDGDGATLQDALRTVWGSFFTHMSFLTTTGFASKDWTVAQGWTDMSTHGIVLAGFCIIGGGVATTAGGAKLLRIYVLYRHGLREMGRLVHPSSIGRAGKLGRDVRREGAFVAWIFFMLFALSIALVSLGLGLVGLSFDEALIFAISTLSTTGPLVSVALDDSSQFYDLGQAGKSILVVAMILGRLETLAIIALMNPDFWRS